MNKLIKENILFFGCGNMSQALIKGLCLAEQKNSQKIKIVSRTTEKVKNFLEKNNLQIEYNLDLAKAVKESSLIILGFKPKDLAVATKELGALISKNQIVVSLLGGIKLVELSQYFAQEPKVLRVMPNVASQVGMGMSIIYSKDKKAEEIIAEIFAITGKTLILEKEEEMDISGVLGGCVPAFTAQFIEGLVDAGTKFGLPWQKSLLLASQAIAGAAVMSAEGIATPAEIKNMVSSPGGITIAGTAELEKRAFKGTVISAIETSTLRSIELGKK